MKYLAKYILKITHIFVSYLKVYFKYTPVLFPRNSMVSFKEKFTNISI